jgi:hypothetical protein
MMNFIGGARLGGMGREGEDGLLFARDGSRPSPS